MSEIASDPRPHVFSGKDYRTWARKMEEYLCEKRVWRFAEGTAPRPELEEYETGPAGIRLYKQDREKWELNEAACRGTIGGCLDKAILEEISHLKTAADRWKYLKEKYTPKDNPLEHHEDMSKLFEMKFTGNSKAELETHFEEMSRLNHKLKDLALADNVLAHRFVHSVPKGGLWSVVRDGAFNTATSLDKLESRVVQDYYLQRIDFDEPSVASSALMASTQSPQTPKPSTSKNGLQRKNKECDYCHIRHRPGVCYKKSHDELMASKGAVSNAVLSRSDSSLLTSAQPTAGIAHNVINPAAHPVFMGVTISNALAATLSTSASPTFKEELYVDSGCTAHVTCIQHYFDDDTIETLMPPVPIRVGNNASTFATHRGTISFVAVKSDGSTADLILSNVLYCSELATTLLAPSQLNLHNLKVILDGPESTIIHKPTSFVVAQCPALKTGLYKLIGHPKGSKVYTTFLATTRTIDINRLHRSLGHLNYDDCRRLVAKRMVGDVDSYTGKDAFCEECVLAKHSRKPFPVSKTRVHNKLELIHSDLMGPFPLSNGKARYLLTFIDHYSDYCWVYPLAKKSDAFEKFKEWQVRAELESGERVKIFCTDGGGEFTSKEFEKYLLNLGIVHQTTTPHTPQQNGKAERKNRTLLTRGLAMLLESKLSDGFWAEALSSANDVINRCPNSNQKGRTPFEVWHGTKPSVTHLKPFGCPAYAYDPSPIGKLSPRSRFCRYLGYGDSTKGYRLWYPKEHRAIYSRDVIFDELASACSHIPVPPKGNISEVTKTIEGLLNEPEPIPTFPITGTPQLTPRRRTISVEDDTEDEEEIIQETEVTAIENHGLQTPDPTPRIPSAVNSRDQTPVAPTPRPSLSPSLSPPPPTPTRETITTPSNMRRRRRPEHERLYDFYEHHPLPQEPMPETNSQLAEIMAQFISTPSNVSALMIELLDEDFDTATWTHELQEERFKEMLDVEFDDLGIGMCLTAISGPEEPPKTIRQVLTRPEKERDQWIEAIHKEIDSLINRGVIEVVDSVPAGKKLLNSSVVLKVKRTVEGTIERYKARIVADGRRQQAGIDYNETFAPVVKMSSIRILLALATQYNLDVDHIDVETAFLYGNLDEELYMRPPAGWEKLNLTGRCLGEIWRLLKSLYGIKQASRIWNMLLDKVLGEFGMSRLHSDVCIYVYKNGKDILYIAVYVDDVPIAHNNPELASRLKKHLATHFRIKDLQGIHQLLNVEVNRFNNNSTTELSQRHYIRELVKKFGIDTVTIAPTPVVAGTTFTTQHCPQNDAELEEAGIYPYRELIGSLMYIMTATRPDIAFAVSSLSRFLSNPGKHHWDQALRVLHYLRDTEDLVIRYSRQDSFDSDSLVGYSDSDWAGDIDRRRSTSGYVFTLCGGPVCWKSRLQTIVATSSMEAEYIATMPACQEAIWLRRLLTELGIPQNKPTTLNIDNLGAIAISKDPKDHQRTRHIDIRFHYIRDCVKNGLILAEWIPTSQNLADLFTKALSSEVFSGLRSMLGLLPRSA